MPRRYVSLVLLMLARAARAEITIAKRMIWLAEVEIELFMCVGNFPWIFMICRIFFSLHLCTAGFIRRRPILTTFAPSASLGIITFILCNLACLYFVPFYLLWIIVINDGDFFFSVSLLLFIHRLFVFLELTIWMEIFSNIPYFWNMWPIFSRADGIYATQMQKMFEWNTISVVELVAATAAAATMVTTAMMNVMIHKFNYMRKLMKIIICHVGVKMKVIKQRNYVSSNHHEQRTYHLSVLNSIRWLCDSARKSGAFR